MKAKKIDQTIRVKIRESENKDSNFLNWDKEDSWLKIRQLLDHKQTKVVVWMCSMAASLSIVFGQPMELVKNWLAPSENQSEIRESQTQTVNHLKKVIETDFNSKEPSLELTSITSKNPLEAVFIETLHLPVSIKANITTKDEEAQPSFESKPNLKTQLFTNYSDKRVGAGIRVNIQRRISPKNNGLNMLGLSLDYSSSLSMNVYSNNEVQQSNPALFLGLLAGNEEKWFTTISYNLLTRQESDSMPAIRLAYLHRISKNFYFGPELKFTNNFRQFYPGITLTLG